MPTKNKKMSIRISQNDLERIKSKVQNSGLTLTNYITKCCLSKQIIVIDGLEFVLKEQKAIGRNLNQLVTLANMGRVQTANLGVLIAQTAAVNASLQELLERKRWSV